MSRDRLQFSLRAFLVAVAVVAGAAFLARSNVSEIQTALEPDSGFWAQEILGIIKFYVWTWMIVAFAFLLVSQREMGLLLQGGAIVLSVGAWAGFLVNLWMLLRLGG